MEKERRRPRVLHIGNIANNAYINAKLLNAAGLDCDVICYDYYHIMGCPEWEDADIEGEIEDQFRPKWSRVNLNGFQRPRWFAQGPLWLCIRYLVARRSGSRRAELWWWLLGQAQLLGWIVRLFRGAARLMRASGRLARRPTSISFLGIIVGVLVIFYPLTMAAVIIAASALSLPVLHSSRLRSRAGSLLAVRRARYGPRDLNTSIYELLMRFMGHFPERPDQLRPTDLRIYRLTFDSWQALFGHYDLVQGYSTDPILPLVAGKRPYCAFEHGTLREIPFQANARGRRTALAYREADHVFVTNADCLDNAKELAGARVTFINHPFDEDHSLKITGWQQLRRRLCGELDASFLFFFPTRHDWVEGKGFADKANDVFLRAFVELRRRGHNVGMVCCDWGGNVEQSKGLLAAGGVSRHVRLTPPLGTIQFDRTVKACDLVVDQFMLGAIGGVLFKALSAGGPVLTYLDDAAVRAHYAEVPPVINCKTSEQIIETMPRYIDQPGLLGPMREASRAWIKKYHACADTVAAQMEVFGKLLCRQGPGAPISGSAIP